jgi:ABC-type antimicrobial peptide transport system permease subunit
MCRTWIGVRMALGATTRNIARLVFWQSVRPVGFGLLLGGGLAGSLAAVLVSVSVVSPVGGVVHVFDPAAYGASLLIIMTACAAAASIPTVRAARIDPIATLRND